MTSASGGEPGSPAATAEREVRFGLVLYGGVSLAVYIYGVVYEFQRLVRASQGVETNAWTEVLKTAGVSATVDIVSGASAGGINGVLLGKALASGGDLRAVRSIWLDDADLGRLLREAGEEEPSSLLKSEDFRTILDRGLSQMDQQTLARPLVSAFDLFAAATRLRPWIREFPTDLDGSIQTKDYRKIFKLKFRRPGYNREAPEAGYSRNDFLPGQNSVLADVAQATSAFPGAFEPVKITVDKESNGHLFRPDEPKASYFSDGGILHNKPFTETISTILKRAAGRPVDRWLISVEPDPEHSNPSGDEEEEPQVTEVVARAAVGIPRYQSIAADLALFEEHRERARKAREKLVGIDETLRRRIADLSRESDEPLLSWREQVLLAANYREERWRRFREALSARLAAAEPGRSSWDRTRVMLVLDELEVGLLELADPDFERRRVYHLLELVRPLLADSEAQEGREKIAEQQLLLWAQFDRIDEVLWELFSPEVERPPELTGFGPRTLETIVGRLKTELDDVRRETREVCERLDTLRYRYSDRREKARFTVVFDWFELWDVQLLTIAELSDAAARDKIRLARISPNDAHFIQKSPSMKLAGDMLGHFGGFLKREWRQNDLLWGRLDAAEIISRALLREERSDSAKIEAQIRATQAEIVRDELPDIKGDYRSYMENEHMVGSETVGDVPMEKRSSLVLQATDVVRNMARRLQNDEKAHQAGRTVFGALGTALGFALFFLRWPLRAIWGRDPALRRGASLAIVFLGLWSVATLVLIALGIIGTTNTLWTLIGAAAGIFLVWSVLQVAFRKG